MVGVLRPLTPGPSISSACGVWPTFFAMNVYRPGVNVVLDRLILKSLSSAVTTVPLLPLPVGAADDAARLDMALLGEGLLGVTDAVGFAAEVPPLPPQPLTESAATATTATPIQCAGDRSVVAPRCVLMSPPVSVRRTFNTNRARRWFSPARTWSQRGRVEDTDAPSPSGPTGRVRS